MIELNISQVLVVQSNHLIFLEKIDDAWIKNLETDCYYGKNGFSKNRNEGDGTTPIGFFRLLYAFGINDNPRNSNRIQKNYTKFLFFK